MPVPPPTLLCPSTTPMHLCGLSPRKHPGPTSFHTPPHPPNKSSPRPPAAGDLLVFVHADSRPPRTLVPVVRAVLRNPRNVIGGFNTVVELPDRVLLYMTAFHFSKTYLAPLLFRPLSFVRCDLVSRCKHP